MSNESLCHTLVISAWWPEQRALYALVHKENKVTMGNCPIEVSEEENAWLKRHQNGIQRQTFDFFCVGVGAVAAAAKLSLFLERSRKKYSRLIFVGTAGVYEKKLSAKKCVGSAVEIQKIVASDGCLARGHSYFPTGISQLYKCRIEPKFLSATCVNTPSITTDSEVANCLAELGDVENLELYGCVTAAVLHELPWQAFLGIANIVGPDAHLEWKANHIKASLSAQALVYAATGGVGGSSPE